MIGQRTRLATASLTALLTLGLLLVVVPSGVEGHIVNCGYNVNPAYVECLVACNVHMVNDIRNGRLTGCCQYVNKCLVVW